MTEPKGPKVDLPEDLVEELTEQPEGGEAPEAGSEDPQALLQAELEDAKDRHLRLAAEFENFKRRALKERQDQANYANENLIKELLPTVDNLERALEHGRKNQGGDEGQEFLEGVELTYRSMLQALERFGVTVIDAEGKPFDPQFHEAIRQMPSDTHEPGTIVEVFQRGYQLKDRLLRPALVAVAAAG